jgi:hypothetical protein
VLARFIGSLSDDDERVLAELLEAARERDAGEPDAAG